MQSKDIFNDAMNSKNDLYQNATEKLKMHETRNRRWSLNRSRRWNWPLQRPWHMLRGQCSQYLGCSACVYNIWKQKKLVSSL